MINQKKNTHMNRCTIFVNVNNTIIFIRTNYSQLPLINIFRTLLSQRCIFISHIKKDIDIHITLQCLQHLCTVTKGYYGYFVIFTL